MTKAKLPSKFTGIWKNLYIIRSVSNDVSTVLAQKMLGARATEEV